MKILVIGGGGREHALVWKLAQDSRTPILFCAPGNAGTAELATNLAISAEDVVEIVAWAKENRPDLTVVGPEAPLCAGLADVLQSEGLRVFGPNKEAAQLEGSKVFSKDVMVAAGVSTAQARYFDKAHEAMSYIQQIGAPVVIKADGLAAGKGVTVCATVAEAERAITESLIDITFGKAGSRILVEEFLEGEEVSILALIDGEHVVMLPSAQDHKRLLDNDKGPNTGGMGAYSPAPVATPELLKVIETEVFGKLLVELKKRNIVYRGVLYAGLMITKSSVKVLEFNCRFGDPEIQAILPRLDCDLIPALEACIDGTLTPDLIKWKPEACVCIVMASGGYPGSYEKGKPIVGIDKAEKLEGVTVFHAGTKIDNDGVLVTAGGRVLGVTALGRFLYQAVTVAYCGVGRIKFDKAHFRNDIADRALRRGEH